MLLYQQFFYLLIGLGVLLGLPALWMFARALWPAMVDRGCEVASRGLFVTFLAGLPVVALVVGLITRAGKLGQAGGVVAILIVGLLVMWGLIGVAGLAAHVGRTLWPSCRGDDAWRGMLRGSFVVSGVLAIPFIGWFILLLVLLTLGFGLRVRMAFASRAVPVPAAAAAPSAAPAPPSLPQAGV